MADFDLKRGDTRPKIHGILSDADGPVFLEGATVLIVLRPIRSDPGSAATLVDEATVLDDGSEELKGHVEYAWDPADLPPADGYEGEWRVTFVDDTQATFPNDGFFSVAVRDSAGEEAS